MLLPVCRKYLALLLCLAYLFIGAGGARAFIWCYQSDGSSHAEYNPAGACGADCDAAPQESPFPGAPEDVTDSHGEEDCRDIPFLQAQAKNMRVCDEEILPVSSLPPIAEPEFPRFIEIGTRLLLSPQPPPPSPTLAALRTVVLLN